MDTILKLDPFMLPFFSVSFTMLCYLVYVLLNIIVSELVIILSSQKGYLPYLTPSSGYETLIS